MKQDIGISHGSFMQKLSDVTRQLGFAVLVHEVNSGKTVNIHNGEMSDTTVPANLVSYINNDKEFCSYFSHGDSLVVLYFLRFNTDTHKYVVVVQDSKKRTRLNSFISALFFAMSSSGPAYEAPAAELDDGIAADAFDKNFEMAEKDGIISFMEMRLQEFEELLKNQKNRFEELMNKYERLQQDTVMDNASWIHERQEMEDKLKFLESTESGRQINDLIIENAELKTQLDTIAEEAAAQAEADKQKLEEQVSKLQKELDAMNDITLDLNMQLEQLREQLSQAQATENYDEEINNLHKQIAALEKDKKKLAKDLEELSDSSVSKDENEKLIKELDNIQKIRSNLTRELDEAKKRIEDLENKILQADELYAQMRQQSSSRDDEVAGRELEIEELKKRVNEHQKYADELAGQAEKLRQDSDKMSELVNGLSQPIFTVNAAHNITVANRALLAFCGYSGFDEVSGRPCHSAVYNHGKRCSWCMVDEVKKTGEPTQVSVTIGEEGSGSERFADVTFFPIFSGSGQVVEVAEFISDKTEAVELSTSVSKFKEKLKDFKKARIDDMNEINDVKKAYQELSGEHEKVVDRNNKMMKVVERLVSEDKARELLAVRTELMEVRNKLYRSTEMIKNYKYQLDEQLLKYSDLNKRTFLQMERLLNIMKGKQQMRTEETISILSFLTKEFEMVKKHFVETEKKTTLQALAEAKNKEKKGGRVANKMSGEEIFRSEEEKLLKEKINSEKTTPTGIAAAAAYAKAMLSSAAVSDDEDDFFDDDDDE